jgi:hypothetical protein
MINDRGVFWQVIFYNIGAGTSETQEFDNAEAARKAAQNSGLPHDRVQVFKMDPVHGAVEIMW